MTTERPCVYIPLDEYRELIVAKTQADCLKAAIKGKQLDYTDLDLICKMFGIEDKEKVIVAPEQDESW